MSKLDKCFNEAIASGKLSIKLAEELRQDASIFEAQLKAQGIHSSEQAKILGVEEAAKHRTLIAKRNKYQKVLQGIANENNVKNMKSHRKNKTTGLLTLFVKDLRGHKGDVTWSNVDNRSSAIEGQAHSLAADMLQNLHTTHLGWGQDRDTLLATVREIFGEATGNEKAAKSGTAFSKAAEYLRERYNRAGGFIPKRNDWGMPQVHDQVKVSKAGMDAWIEYTLPRLNREAMVNADGRIMSDDELMQAMRESYKTVSTDGQNKKVPGAFSGNGKMANRHQDSRFLVFKDADSWIEYQESFGSPDFFNVMVGHIRSMSSEIAMLEILGPNPNMAFKYLSDITENDGNMGMVNSVWNVVSGSADMVDVNRESLAKGTAFTRHLLMAAQLGGAAISSITDPVYGKMTRAFNGLPIVKSIQHTVGQLNPADESDRAFAAHLGMVMDGWSSQALVGSRFSGEMDPAGKASKISETLFRASGLTAWTQGQRNSFGLDFQWHLARQMGNPLSEVESKFQGMMRRYGITDDDWEIMRSVPLEEHGGTSYFRPQNMHDLDLPTENVDNLVTKILEAMNTEMDFAVPTPDARVRAIQTWGGKERGSFTGEAARMTMMYKSFSMTQFMTHMYRNGPKFVGVYALRLGISLSVMGALAIQMKEISRGREPRQMDGAFLFAAMMQGGGLGIFGDFIDASGVGNKSRFGNSVMATAMGPGASLVEDVVGLGVSGFDFATDPFTGDETNLGREAARFLQRYTPGNNLWYGRLLFERYLFDNLQEMTDSKAKQNRKKYERKIKTERGQDYWWKRGDSSPQF
tara:strand:- start:79 stop:2493 length:2415 start_codon:yes stop_codon:yes gene_type:complete